VVPFFSIRAVVVTATNHGAILDRSAVTKDKLAIVLFIGFPNSDGGDLSISACSGSPRATSNYCRGHLLGREEASTSSRLR
jgi:hypothetical protein